MATFLLDFGSFLADNNVVTGDGVDYFRDFLPEDPTHLVTLQEYPGLPGMQHEEKVHRSFQVIVRGEDSDAVRSKALGIYNLLNTPDKFVQFTPDRWGQVSLRQTPFRLDRDGKLRVSYAFNIGVTTSSE